MLKYKIKPSSETVLNTFPIKELYVAPDLTQITGVTDYNVGLVNGEEIVIKSPYLIGDEIDTINVSKVKRQGKIGVKITLPVKTIEKTLKFIINYDYQENKSYIIVNNDKVEVDDNGSGYVYYNVSQNYVEYNGDISYFFNGSSKTGYLIDHKFYTASITDKTVDIVSYLYIENGNLTVGNNVYGVDFSDLSNKPIIRLNKYSDPISGGSYLGNISGNTYSAISDSDDSVLIKDYHPQEWSNMSYFSILKHENPTINAEDVMFGGYNHYIIYKNKNYYLEDIYENDEYIGYGVRIDGKYYLMDYGYINEDVFKYHHDIQCNSCSVFIGDSTDEISDETENEDENVETLSGTVFEVNDALYSSHNSGNFIILIDKRENSDITIGNFIEANSYYSIPLTLSVEEDENGDRCVFYNGQKYGIKDRMYDTIKISNNEYRINYLDDENTSGYCEINGDNVYFKIDEESEDSYKATIDSKIYYYLGKTENGSILVNYGIDENGYDVDVNSGVTINGVDYKIIKNKEDSEDNSYYVNINSPINFLLKVEDIDGSSSYLCYPVCDNDELSEIEQDELQREICTLIVDNWKKIEFKLRKDTFGNKKLTVENGLMESMVTDKPFTLSNNYLLENKIELFRLQNYLSLKFPIVNKIETNINREDIVKHDFVDYISKNSINKIIDMEKDVYYPVWKSEENNEIKYNRIEKLVFNLHFRNRTLDNWKVIEDDREFSNVDTPNSIKSNWFVTDYKYYKDFDGDVLQNSSDLLGLVGFSTNEIKSTAKKISRSFLRLSFYTTNNPNTQVLLYTSTIFLDENNALKKYMSLKRSSFLVFANIETLEQSSCSSITHSECAEIDNITSYTTSNLSEIIGDSFLTDSIRLSSRFNVNDKYTTNTSSDGYYLYLFKEYAKKMHETTIYLKVEFNHAGIGKSIQFMLPRKEDESGLYRLKNENDVKELLDGFKMQDIYKQTYIPIKIVYDDVENKYVYYLPNGLREQTYLDENSKISLEDEIMEFNLFEVKFANESLVELRDEGS